MMLRNGVPAPGPCAGVARRPTSREDPMRRSPTAIAPRIRRPRRRPSPSRPRPSLRLTFEPLEDRTMLSTVNWINPAGGDWDTASDWSGGQLPGSGDDVTINALNVGASITHLLNKADSVNSITAAAPVTLWQGTLTVAGTFNDSS